LFLEDIREIFEPQKEKSEKENIEKEKPEKEVEFKVFLE
jgi:hypothetical protein